MKAKALIIAAAGLALSGAVLAQAETAGEKAAAALQEARQAAGEAAGSAGEAARAAGTAIKEGTKDAVAATRDAAHEAAVAAEGAAHDAATATGHTVESIQSGVESELPAPAVTDAPLGATDTAAAPVVAPDVQAPAISATEPGILSSWVTSRRIWTTNEPSSTPWNDPDLTARPQGWQDIAKVDEIVLDDQGSTVGFLADIGGFLGIGAKKVLLGKDAIHLIHIGDDWIFATNFTKAELEALPGFDPATVLR